MLSALRRPLVCTAEREVGRDRERDVEERSVLDWRIGGVTCLSHVGLLRYLPLCFFIDVLIDPVRRRWAKSAFFFKFQA